MSERASLVNVGKLKNSIDEGDGHLLVLCTHGVRLLRQRLCPPFSPYISGCVRSRGEREGREWLVTADFVIGYLSQAISTRTLR